MSARERAEGVIRDVLNRAATNEYPSDILDDLSSAGFSVVPTWDWELATTPGDDRGRELAERDDERRWDIGNALGWELENESPSWREVMKGIADLRAVGVPAAPEAGDRAALSRVLDALADIACTFWACQGPDVPHQDMETCRVCAVIQDVRTVLAAAPSDDRSRGLPDATVIERALRDACVVDAQGHLIAYDDDGWRTGWRPVTEVAAELAALAVPADTEAVIEAFARLRHEATGRDMHNGRNIRPDGDARGASPIGLCTWAEAPEDWREGYRELCRHDARLAATPPVER